MVTRDLFLMTEQLTIQFPSLREVMKSYILFKVMQFNVKEVRKQYLHIYNFLVFQFKSFVSIFKQFI